MHSIIKYSVLQKWCESIFTGSCMKLASAGSTSVVRGVHKSQLPWLPPCSFEVGSPSCLEQLWPYPLHWAANWRDSSPWLRKFPDSWEKLGLCSEALWSFSRSADRLRSTWLSYTTDGQQAPLAAAGAVPRDKCSLCLGCNLAVYIQAKCHRAWLK